MWLVLLQLTMICLLQCADNSSKQLSWLRLWNINWDYSDISSVVSTDIYIINSFIARKSDYCFKDINFNGIYEQ